MSSKTQTTATKEEARPALVPKLRFPEFRWAEWVQKKLEDVAPLQRGFDLPSDLIRPGNIPIVYSNGVQKYHEVGMATAPGLVTGRSGTIGKLHFIENGEYWPHNTSLWVTDFKGNVPQFVYYLYDSIGMGRFSSGSGVPTLNRNDVHAFSSLVPSSIAEQQKIAECLSSVDELMAAQAQKVDALKTHKKGLMQQLFPREGETQPRLRFPEFQNAGDWVAKPLGEIFPISSSKRVHESDWTTTGVPFYRAREIVALNKHEPIQPLFISEELYSQFCKLTGEIREGHLLVTGVGSIGVPYLVKMGDRFYFKDGNIIWLKNDGKELIGNFLLRLYETDNVQKQLKTMADVGTVATYTIDNAKRTLAVFPFEKAEQHRIASCLSSLDALITFETQKLEALKTHKKGLMQQLFPSVEGTA